VHDDLLEAPLKWRKPRVIFVNSMSDLFHEEVPEYFIKNVFEIMNSCPQHTFQLLTKRSKRLKELSLQLRWAHNIWMGVSVENTETTHRIKDLVKTNARVKFVSCEPLIGPINRMPLKNIDWIIVGGESGPHSRVMEKQWAISIRNQCIRQSVSYFFKQWGGTRKKVNGRILEGRTWDEMPTLAHQSESTDRL
jgi:protein gp37